MAKNISFVTVINMMPDTTLQLTEAMAKTGDWKVDPDQTVAPGQGNRLEVFGAHPGPCDCFMSVGEDMYSSDA